MLQKTPLLAGMASVHADTICQDYNSILTTGGIACTAVLVGSEAREVIHVISSLGYLSTSSNYSGL